MSARVGEDKIAEVRDRTSLVEIVSRYTALRRTGRNHTGLCPFHAEKTPSFSVSEDRGLFYCFGCQASGDVFKFLMLKENLTFPEALERLAREAGVELPKRPAEERREQSRERLLRVNAFAAKFFERSLWEGTAAEAARKYLAGRRIGEDTARAFGLGLAPGDGLWRALERAGAPLGDAESLGLVGRSNRGGWFDRFRNRLMFPIHDLAAKTIAFGGRALPQSEEHAKYINSADSALFQKGRSVFGLSVARDAIRERDRVVIVEGYFDVIALAQAGVRNVVAPLGTALTGDQVRLLKRFTGAFVVLFDGDPAGLAAAARAFSVFAEAGIFAEAAFLPAGEDPDTFVQKKGAEGVERLLRETSPLVDHYLRSLAPPGAALAERARAAQTAAELCGRLGDPIFVGLLRRRAADYLSLPEEQLLGGRRGVRTGGETPPASRSSPPGGIVPHESTIFELLIVQPDLKARLPPSIEDLLPRDEARSLLRRICATEKPADLVGELPPTAAERVWKALRGDTDVYPAPERMIEECVARLTERAREGRLRALTQRIREAESRGDAAELGALLTEKQRLSEGKTRVGSGDG